jgi:hypothetical protein
MNQVKREAVAISLVKGMRMGKKNSPCKIKLTVHA